MQDRPSLDALLAELTARVARLEARFDADAAEPEAPVDVDAHDVVSFDGRGVAGTGEVAWRSRRAWGQVLASDAGHAALVFAALGNPIRVRIVRELLSGSRTTRELLDQLGAPTTGQLFHHLKELLAIGVIHQPERGTYAVLHQDVVPLLVLMSATMDLGRVGDREPR